MGVEGGLLRKHVALSLAQECSSPWVREGRRLLCILKIHTVVNLAYMTLLCPSFELQAIRTHFFPFIQITETWLEEINKF